MFARPFLHHADIGLYQMTQGDQRRVAVDFHRHAVRTRHRLAVHAIIGIAGQRRNIAGIHFQEPCIEYHLRLGNGLHAGRCPLHPSHEGVLITLKLGFVAYPARRRLVEMARHRLAL